MTPPSPVISAFTFPGALVATVILNSRVSGVIRLYLNAVRQDMPLGQHEKTDGTIYTRARVPSAVGLIGVFSRDPQFVLFAEE